MTTQQDSLVEMLVATEVGPLRLVANEHALVGVYFPEHKPAPRFAGVRVTKHALLDHAKAELLAYFRGELQAFETPLMAAGTEFQEQVWRALREIPYGELRSYSDIARAIAAPKAVRAVGAANGRNPLSIFVPCHRVIGASGALTGYAGGHAAKRSLLALEQAHTRTTTRSSGFAERRLVDPIQVA